MNKRVLIGLIVFFLASIGVFTFALTTPGDEENGDLDQNGALTPIVETDEEAPVITLVGDATVYVTVGNPYTDAGATADDNEDGDITSDIVETGTVNTSVVGSYTITYDVDDAAGNSADTVTRTVIVSDPEAPVISLIGANELDVEVLTGTYTEPGATVTDNYDVGLAATIGGDTVDVNVVGTYLVTYDATDSNGNDAVQRVRTVTVVDTVIPVITMVGTDETVEVLTGTYTDDGATALDNYDGDITGSIVMVNPVDVNVIGDYIVTYNVTDSSGNVAVEVTRTVHVVDTVIPVITMLGSDETIESGTTYVDAGATALDNYDGDITGSIIVVNPVDTNVVGVYIITYNVSDSSLNPAVEVTRTVEVVEKDPEALIFFHRKDLSETDIGNAWEVFEAQNNVITDDQIHARSYDEFDDDTYYAGAGVPCINGGICYELKYTADGIYANLTTAPFIDLGEVGIYKALYRVYDATGNTRYRYRWIYVEDTTKPILNLNGTYPTTYEVGMTEPNWINAVDSYTDNVDQILILNATDNVDMNTVGTYQVTYTVAETNVNVESAGGLPRIPLVTTKTLNVDVIEANPERLVFFDKTDGTESDVGNAWETVEASKTAKYKDWVYAKSYDEYDDNTYYAGEDLICMNKGTQCYFIKYTPDKYGPVKPVFVSKVDMSVVGSYYIGYRVYDRTGNSNYRGRWVDVVDTTIPVITMIGSDATVEVGSTYIDDGATALDNIDGNITGSIVVVNLVNTSVIGDYTVTYNVNDLSGNAAVEVVRTVHVIDAKPEKISFTTGWHPKFEEDDFATELPDAGNIGKAWDEYDQAFVPAVFIKCNTFTNEVKGAAVTQAQVMDNPGLYWCSYKATDSTGHTRWNGRRVTIVEATPEKISFTTGWHPVFEADKTATELPDSSNIGKAWDEWDNAFVPAVFVKCNTFTNEVKGAAVTQAQVMDNPGLYWCSYKATDSTGHTRWNGRRVTIEDTTKPTFKAISFLGNPTIYPWHKYEYVEVDPGGTYVDNATIFTDDNALGPVTITPNGCNVDLNVISAPLKNRYSCEYTIEDLAGNKRNTRRYIVVVDTEAPVIKLTGNATMTILKDSTFTDPGSTVTDNYDTGLIATVGGDTVDTSTLGTYVITYNAVDSSGNNAVEKTRTVNVVNDITPPILKFTGYPAPNKKNIVVGYNKGGNELKGRAMKYTASDPESGPVTVERTVNYEYRLKGGKIRTYAVSVTYTATNQEGLTTVKTRKLKAEVQVYSEV